MKDTDCLKYRFALSSRQGILIRLRSSDGFEGWGQAMPHNGILTDANEAEVTEVALDAARCDLASQQADMPLCDWLRRESGNNLLVGAGDASDANDASDIADTTKVLNAATAFQTSPKSIPINALIFGSTPEEVAEAGNLAASSRFPAVKLKVGGGELEGDIARVRALREAVGSKIAIRLDANGAWQPQEALQALRSLAAFDIEYIEEPTAGLTTIAELASQSPIAVAADESIKSVSDLSKLPQLGILVAVVKPAVLGNLKHLLATCRQLVSEGVKSNSLVRPRQLNRHSLRHPLRRRIEPRRHPLRISHCHTPHPRPRSSPANCQRAHPPPPLPRAWHDTHARSSQKSAR